MGFCWRESISCQVRAAGNVSPRSAGPPRRSPGSAWSRWLRSPPRPRPTGPPWRRARPVSSPTRSPSPRPSTAAASPASSTARREPPRSRSTPTLGDATLRHGRGRPSTAPAGSDWDLAVFDAAGERRRRLRLGGADEVASGYVARGRAADRPGLPDLRRRHRRGRSTSRPTPLERREARARRRSRIVETPTARGQGAAAASLGLDLTEHGGEDYVAVVLHGADDRAALEQGRPRLRGRGAGPRAPERRASARADADFARARRSAARCRAAATPTGASFDYTQELKDLAEDNPELVRPITLKHETYEGRPVEGIEITTDADNLRDGKPVFLQMGVHHAREWPSGEHAMEWAYELINGYKTATSGSRDLVEQRAHDRDPDRQPRRLQRLARGRPAAGPRQRPGRHLPDATSPTSPNEYRRKNCRFARRQRGRQLRCSPPSASQSRRRRPEPQLRRLLGRRPAPATIPTTRTTAARARSPSPRPRTSATSSRTRQVTMLITNHTFSNLVLRPPGLASRARLRSTSRSTRRSATRWRPRTATSASRATSSTTPPATTEDWSYNATGGLGFTFEIYCNHIPDPLDDRAAAATSTRPIPNVVAEYEGRAAPTRRRAAAATARPTSSRLEAAADASQALRARGRGAPPARS